MTFSGFTEQDFDSLTVPGLEPRMNAIITHIRPKLELLGHTVSPFLSILCGEEMHPHVAKHARRTVNPPKDTWVAWAPSKRGYKAYPHFEVGMFESHLFIIFAIIYESPNKTTFAESLRKQATAFQSMLPSNYYWSMDHMTPGGTPAGELGVNELKAMADKLQTLKKAEILCGLSLDRKDELLRDGTRLLATIEQTFTTLLPLYKASF